MKLAGLSLLAAGALAGQNCDRACLEGLVEQYMDALIAHDPKALPLARNLKNTENGQRLEPGDGFWRTASAKGTYRLPVTDVPAGQVGMLGTMREANIPVAVAIRLKVANRQISEIETFVVRGGFNNTNAGEELDKLGKPAAAGVLPPAERASRDELIRTANQYYSGLEKNDGKGAYPVSDDCERLENGVRASNNPDFRASPYSAAANQGKQAKGKQAAPPAPPPAAGAINPAAMSCRAALESGYFRFVTRVRDRRFAAVDTERGLVFSFVFHDHAAGKSRTFKLADGREITAGPNRPWTWQIAQVFRIEKGLIRRMESLAEQVPYGMLSGWSAWEEGMSSRAR